MSDITENDNKSDITATTTRSKNSNANFARNGKRQVINKTDEVYNHIGKFLVQLCHKNAFAYDGKIKKQLIRYEFQEYLKQNGLEGSPKYQEHIGTLLRKNDFLINTDRGCGIYIIKKLSFNSFYCNLMEKLDQEQINVSVSKILPEMTPSNAKENLEINPNEDEQSLEFHRGILEKIKHNFVLSNMGCYICQENYSHDEAYDEHLEYHGISSGFQAVMSYDIETSPHIDLSYNTCENSFFLYFTMKSKQRCKITIDKIIIIRQRGVNYARNDEVPYDMPHNGVDHFIIDRHLFTIGCPQPIVIVYRVNGDNQNRYVAQYLFMRHDDFPICNFKLKSTRVSHLDKMKKLGGNLPFYWPPVDLMQLYKNGEIRTEELELLYPVIREYIREDKELKPSNITDIFKVLLYLEDISINNKYKKLDRKGCEIKGFCGEYSVTLKDLDPSINVNEIINPYDEVCLTVIGGDDENDNMTSRNNRGRHGKRPSKKKIWCYVYTNYGATICFRPKNRDTIIEKTKKYDVHFTPGRLQIIYQHRALELLSVNSYLKRHLFPTSNFNKTPAMLSLDYYNDSININPEQMQAVMNITDGPNDAAPYIIFGPPGTGKTTTVVESILQLWKKDQSNKILVTAGSNAACDEVAQRLCKIFNEIDPEGLNLLRIYAASVEKRIDNLSEDLLEVSNLCHSDHFYPSIESIQSYRVIVATLTVVGRLVQANISDNFFTHIFIDECAASTEPEAIVGISGVLSPKSRLILSGDPKQLGPILQSGKASDLGLNISLMERLLSRKCYEVDSETGEYDRSIQTRLKRNFRTHCDILHLSNVLYYDSVLISAAKREITDWCLGWHRLSKKSFPIVFDVVYGHTRRDKGSTSLCNFKELSVTLDYVKNLMFFGVNGRKITEDDIGVISPYKKQCDLIREELDKRRWYKIETGSVETFQGKEKAIIIISMVRSDNFRGVGFLDNPKRLNVTLTRAQALMIIIGNPEVLRKVEDWNNVIEYCKENDGMTGAKYPREPITSNENSERNRNRSRNHRRGNYSGNNRRNMHFENKKQQSVQEEKNVSEDTISLSSNFTNYVEQWIDNTANYRERNAKFDTASSKSSVCDDFEIVDKTNSMKNDEKLKNIKENNSELSLLENMKRFAINEAEKFRQSQKMNVIKSTELIKNVATTSVCPPVQQRKLPTKPSSMVRPYISTVSTDNNQDKMDESKKSSTSKIYPDISKMSSYSAYPLVTETNPFTLSKGSSSTDKIQPSYFKSSLAQTKTDFEKEKESKTSITGTTKLSSTNQGLSIGGFKNVSHTATTATRELYEPSAPPYEYRAYSNSPPQPLPRSNRNYSFSEPPKEHKKNTCIIS